MFRNLWTNSEPVAPSPVDELSEDKTESRGSDECTETDDHAEEPSVQVDTPGGKSDRIGCDIEGNQQPSSKGWFWRHAKNSDDPSNGSPALISTPTGGPNFISRFLFGANDYPCVDWRPPHLSKLPKGRTRGPLLLQGEALVIRFDLVYFHPAPPPLSIGKYASLAADAVLGDAYLTTYALHFMSYECGDDGESICCSIPVSNICQVHLPSGIGRDDGVGPMEVYGKNNNRMVLSFVQQSTQPRRLAYDAIQQYAFPESVRETFAFSYDEHFEIDGWKVFDMKREYERIGFPASEWRLSEVNAEYSVCDTYPHLLVVPANINEDEVRASASFRSKGRFPVCVWRHDNGAVIMRCSQPKTGMSASRCPEDEMLVRSCIVDEDNEDRDKIGFMILDCRPKANAVANRAMGAGYENTNNYERAALVFANIQNIHVVRDSFGKMRRLLLAPVNDLQLQQNIVQTQWLEHISGIIANATKCVECIEKHRRSVVVHCSDGWDRTSQISALAQLFMDPYYRTLEGFAVMIEKEWLAFGHRFELRVGHTEVNFFDEQRAPIFVQFVECIWHLMSQFPTAFEYTEQLLVDTLDAMYSCRFGTFLFNCERERANANLCNTTKSFWGLVLSHREEYSNPFYAPASRTLYPDSSLAVLRLWSGYHLRFGGIEGIANTQKSQKDIYSRMSDMICELRLLKQSLQALSNTDVEDGSSSKQPENGNSNDIQCGNGFLTGPEVKFNEPVELNGNSIQGSGGIGRESTNGHASDDQTFSPSNPSDVHLPDEAPEGSLSNPGASIAIDADVVGLDISDCQSGLQRNEDTCDTDSQEG